LNWRIKVTKDLQQAGEYAILRQTSVAAAIAAYGKAVCRVLDRRSVVATWGGRGIRITGVANSPLPAGKTGCSAPALVRVAEIRLTDRRWTTGLNVHVGDTVQKLRRLYERRWTTGLNVHVGDTVQKLRRLYERTSFVRTTAARRRSEYYLVWRRVPCVARCTAQAKRRGINIPRLSAEVKNGRVVAFRLPVAAPIR
jgi:hypothetical protein